MCVVSMIGDHYADKWRDRILPYQRPIDWPYWPVDEGPASSPGAKPVEHPTREEFDALRKEVEDMKALLKSAVEYDERNNEPHCEVEEKMELLRRVAEMVGISLDDVIGKSANVPR